MTKQEILDQMAKASQIVATWPTWKQNILIQSSQPSMTTPRTPVNNQIGYDEQKRDSH